MKKYLILLLLIVLGAALSFVLIPDAREIALMQFRDKEFEQARVTYEQRLAAGDLTVEVVSALTNLHLQSGDVDKAIDVMQRFVAENSDNVKARHELGKLYQFAQRLDDYLRNLEEINRIEKNADSLGTMNEMYAASQDYEKQEPALEALVGAAETRQPNHYRNLARLKSSQQKLDEAIVTYQELWQVHPDAFKFDDLEVMMTYQLELDHVEDAYASAVKYAEKQPKMKEIARLVNVLHYRGDAEIAMRFLEPYEGQLPQHPTLGVEKAYILLAQNKRTEGYEVLRWLDGVMTLPTGLQREYIYLLAQNGEYEEARSRLQALDFSILQESEGISLIELALISPESKLMPVLEAKLSENVAANYNVLQAAIAAATNKPNWKALMNGVDKNELTNAQRLQMANVCLRSGKRSCVGGFLEALNLDALSKPQVLQAAGIYMEIGNYKMARTLVEPIYQQDPQDVAVSAMYVRLAAANGKADVVKSWIASNPNASEESLRDIYFTAQRYRQSNIALDTVDVLAKNYQTEKNLGFLIDAYVANGRYEAVLPYFREKSTLSGSDREDYLYVLTKLSRKNNRYSAELVEFAGKEMRRPGVSFKQKQALVYALLDAGRPDVVLPFIEEFARNHGGQWIEVYAGNLDKLGRHSEARDFRMRLAMNPSTSDKARRSIAFQLLEKGFRVDAESLFAMMADGAAPESTAVQQLLYLWGARPNIDKIDWLGARYASETNPMAQAKWASYVANYSTRDDLLTVVSRFPELVNEKPVQDRYFDALNQIEQLGAYGDDLLSRDDISPSALRLFARAARGYNLNGHALQAYHRLNDALGGDAEAMRVIGILAFSRADYSETLEYLTPYVEYREENPGYHEEDYEAYYYLAETLKRDRDMDAANAYYAKALEAVSVVREADIDSVSKTAQSLIGYGDEQQGREYFQSGLQQFPANRLLVADYISSVIELKDYDLAKELLASSPVATVTNGYVGQSLDLPPSSASRYQVQVDGNEAVLRFEGPVPENFALLHATKIQFPWLSYVSQSYDEVLIVAESNYNLEIQPLSAGYVLTAVTAPNSAQERFAEELDVRYQMLDARVDLETGEHYDATNDLLELTELHPNNATLLGYTANALNFTGRWKYAQRLLERANEIMPANEDILALQRDINIRRDAENHVKVDYEWVSVGDSDEKIWTLSGLVYVDEELEIGAKLQTVDVDAVNVRRIDGRLGNFDEDAQRGEIFIAHEDLDGQRIQASLYGNNDTFGLGMSYQWLNSVGVSRVYAEYQRPNWDFIEGILDDATRDRIGFDHSYVHNPLWSFNGGVAFNRYNLKGEDDVAKSMSGLFSATRTLQGVGPYLAANYTLDAEYRIGEKLFTDNLGGRYFPLLDSREVHTASLIAAEQFTPQTDGLIQAGYSYDRLGGNGPLVAGQLTHQMFEEQLEAQIRGSYGARTSDSEGDTARLGGHLKWRF
ncbi:MAG: hypothetical protein P8P30_06250 [Rickettsiales bacterium]|nr:hypothetical protein [Rickettsiales bacterium]